MREPQNRKDLTVTEAAKELAHSTGTVRNWCRSGRIHAYRPGRDYRIPWSEIERIKSERA